MPNRLPTIFDKHKICIICEGNEEYYYIEKIKELKVWNEKYEIKLDNAEGNGNIPARYQERYQSDSYELVLVFCDTEKKPYEQYIEIKRKINEFHNIDNVADELIMFGNPCTMQIITKHWTDEIINSPAKKVNSPLIENFTGVKNYKAKTEQIIEIMKYITAENYADMHQRVENLSSNDSEIGSSNFDKFLKFFSSNSTDWIDDINKKLETAYD